MGPGPLPHLAGEPRCVGGAGCTPPTHGLSGYFFGLLTTLNLKLDFRVLPSLSILASVSKATFRSLAAAVYSGLSEPEFVVAGVRVTEVQLRVADRRVESADLLLDSKLDEELASQVKPSRRTGTGPLFVT